MDIWESSLDSERKEGWISMGLTVSSDPECACCAAGLWQPAVELSSPVRVFVALTITFFSFISLYKQIRTLVWSNVRSTGIWSFPLQTLWKVFSKLLTEILVFLGRLIRDTSPRFKFNCLLNQQDVPYEELKSSIQIGGSSALLWISAARI